MLYLFLFMFAAVFLMLDSARIGVKLTVLESLSASIATIGSIGPGFRDLGPFGSYLFFSDISKPVQCLRYSSQDPKANSPK